MRYSKFFLKTKKNASKESDSKNARYFERANMLEKHMAGVYAFLPLGLKIYRKIENVVREEMNQAGGQEILMNVLQPKELWDETGRFEAMKEIFFKTENRKGNVLGLGPSHEEQVVDIFRRNINSYKDLPVSLYQFETKFRNEPRVKSGLLRGREFIMKDMYSFHADEADFEQYYEMMKESYLKVFRRLGLDAKLTEASGGAFTEKRSHEFQVFNEIGEDKIYHCGCGGYWNKEIVDDHDKKICDDCGQEIKVSNGIEVGNIFPLEIKYTRDMKVEVLDNNGKKFYPVMGCYGIGMSRLMATVVEVYFDEQNNKMLWPEELSPYGVELISLGENDKADKLYQALSDKGLDVFYDDREVNAGEKFADADLIGCGVKVVVSKKSLAGGGVELIDEYKDEKRILSEDELLNYLHERN